MVEKGKPHQWVHLQESPNVLWEDWIPTLEQAAIWNGWSEEKLLQLAGHL